MTAFDRLRTALWDRTRADGAPPLTPAAIAEAEHRLGVTLPADLLALLRVRNGGTVSADFDAFPTTRPTPWAEDHVPFDHLLGIGGPLSLLDTPYLVREWGLPSPVVLLSGDGHTWIALDHRHRAPDDEPSVCWLDAESGTELPLAPTFRAFLEGLVPATAFDQD